MTTPTPLLDFFKRGEAARDVRLLADVLPEMFAVDLRVRRRRRGEVKKTSGERKGGNEADRKSPSHATPPLESVQLTTVR